MPVFRLSEVGEFRLQSLSFFLVGFLVLSVVVWKLWNGLRRDFPNLPRLSYRGALALMTCWGLLMLVVLTLISGARELLSPKAWVRDGLVYRTPDDPIAWERLRGEHIEDLRDALWAWAEAHDGAFPAHAYGDDLPERRWRIPGLEDRYRYRGGARRGDSTPLAYEGEAVGRKRWVLFADGRIEHLDADALRGALRGSP